MNTILLMLLGAVISDILVVTVLLLSKNVRERIGRALLASGKTAADYYNLHSTDGNEEFVDENV